jgi:hypothetical protein
MGIIHFANATVRIMETVLERLLCVAQFNDPFAKLGENHGDDGLR